MAGFSLPNLQGDINGAQDLRQLKNYLFMLVENLEFILNNLDSENMSENYNSKNNYVSVSEAAAAAKQSAAEAQAVAVQIGKLSVPAARIIAAINESTEAAPIKGNKIITKAAEGELTLLCRDSAGNIAPCMAEITGDAENGYTLTITATE